MPDVTFDPPRDLMPEERAILDFVIEANAEHRDFLQRLLRDSKVTGLCQCGCGSPNLTADESVFQERPPSMPLSLEKLATATVDGVALMVLLFVDYDEPRAALEYVWRAGRGQRPSRLPRVDELVARSLDRVPGQLNLDCLVCNRPINVFEERDFTVSLLFPPTAGEPPSRSSGRVLIHNDCLTRRAQFFVPTAERIMTRCPVCGEAVDLGGRGAATFIDFQGYRPAVVLSHEACARAIAHRAYPFPESE